MKKEVQHDLSYLLGALDAEAKKLAASSGLDAQKLKDALDAALNGDFTLLDALMNDAGTDQGVKDVLDAYKQAINLYIDSEQGGSLDAAKLKKLEDTLKKLSTGAQNSALPYMDSVKKWNDLIKLADQLPDDAAGLGQQELATALDIIYIVQQALAAAGYPWDYGLTPGYGYGAVPGYGYGAAAGYEPSVPPAPSPVVTAPIILSNPAENAVTMPFLLNGQTSELAAGQSVELPAGQAWEIKFDRGAGFGTAVYSLVDGPYEFTYTQQGWDLALSQTSSGGA
jgi:hypothetical protein